MQLFAAKPLDLNSQISTLSPTMQALGEGPRQSRRMDWKEKGRRPESIFLP
jgi:hypothetical protein